MNDATLTKISVGISDAHEIVRVGIKTIVAQEADLNVVGEACCSESALGLVIEKNPAVLVFGLGAQPENGLEVIGRIRLQCKLTSILVFSSLSEEHYALASPSSGAAGFVSKSSTALEVLAAIRALGRGRKYISSAVGETLARQLARKVEPTLPHESLSPREMQVFIRLAQGFKSEKIALELGVDAKSITTFRHRALKKLGLHSNGEITQYAMLKNLIQDC